MMWKMWEMKKMFDSYKKLQNVLKKTIIRAKESGVIIDITAEMKVKDVKIEDDTLLSVDRKTDMEDAIKACFIKGQTKAQEIAMEKTKEILGFDPNDLAGMMWGGGGMPNIPGLN